jgi:Flp pilus assembly protein protease CpaA
VFGIVMPAIAIFVLLVGMTVLGFIDAHKQEVEDWATLILGSAVIAALRADGISEVQWTWAGLSAATVFLAYLEMGTFGRMGGGDVKLSPVPAAVIGAINPLLAIWSVALAFSIQSGFQLVNQRVFQAKSFAMPHVPAMLAGAFGAILFAERLLAVQTG